MKPPNIEVIHEDDDILIISKPAGLLSIPDRYNKNLPSVAKMLSDSRSEVFTVHRLDKDTSGVMIFAKNAKAHAHLNQQFQSQKVTKYYLLMVVGTTPERGQIDVNLTVHPVKSQMMATQKGGKAAITDFETLKHYHNYSLIKAHPHSGRTHQLRVHFSYLKHEIIADPIYGTHGPLFLSQFKRKYKPSSDKPERPLMDRLALHAESISFKHPGNHNRLSFEAALPKDFRATVRQLDKWT